MTTESGGRCSLLTSQLNESLILLRKKQSNSGKSEHPCVIPDL